MIKHASEGFCNLFTKKPVDLNGLNFADILPLGLLKSVNRLLHSQKNSKKLTLIVFLEIDKDNGPAYTVNLTKIFGRKNEPK